MARTRTRSSCPAAFGARGDGHQAGELMSRAEARTYHSLQARAFADADMITAITMTYPAEAIGVVEAARTVGLPGISAPGTGVCAPNTPTSRCSADAVAPDPTTSLPSARRAAMAWPSERPG